MNVRDIIGRLLVPCAVAAMAAAAGGCFNFEIAKTPDFTRKRLLGNDGMPIGQVVTSNYGWYLFNKYPIFCGNANPDRCFPTVFFRDDVTLDTLQDRLVDVAQKMKVDLVDVHATYVDTCMIPIPTTYVNTTFGFLWYKELQLSAVMVDPTHPAVGLQEKRKRQLKSEMDSLLESLEERQAKEDLR